jgi:hypothetical protein
MNESLMAPYPYLGNFLKDQKFVETFTKENECWHMCIRLSVYTLNTINSIFLALY